MKLVNQGMILGEMEFTGFRKAGVSDKAKGWVSAASVEFDSGRNKTSAEVYERVKLPEEDVEKHGEGFVLKSDPSIRVDARAVKMSKARGNVINPDHVVNEYGADSLRLYEMFMGPLEAVKPWSMRGVEGVYRFLGRVWRLFLDDRSDSTTLLVAVQDIEPDRETLKRLHRTIQKVTEDLDGMRFNTAIAAMMEFVNFVTRLEVRPRRVLEPFVLLLAPFAPHLAEELWHVLGHGDTLAYEPWPTFDPAFTKDDAIEVPVQVNGKLRSKLNVPADADQETLRTLALADEKIKVFIDDKQIKKVIVVPGKLVNIVVG